MDDDKGNDTIEAKGSNEENSVDDNFKATVIAHFWSLLVSAPGQEVIREVRFICESMGYSLKCQTSIFLRQKEVGRNSETVEEKRVLKTCILQCRKKGEKGTCGVSLKIKTLTLEDIDEGKSYVGDFWEATNHHPPSRSDAGTRHLHPKRRREALYVTNKLQFSLPDNESKVYLKDAWVQPWNKQSKRFGIYQAF